MTFLYSKIYRKYAIDMRYQLLTLQQNYFWTVGYLSDIAGAFTPGLLRAFVSEPGTFSPVYSFRHIGKQQLCSDPHQKTIGWRTKWSQPD